MKKWITPLLITFLFIGVGANGYLYYRQSIIIRNNEVQITGLRTDLDTLTANVNNLSTSLSNLQVDVQSARDEIASLNRNTQAITVALSDLSDSVNRLGARQVADFTSVAENVKPSVVAIKVAISSTFFGFRFTQQAEASGWIIDSDGLIVTNSHVVADAISIEVTLADGRTFPSVGVQSDTATDLAVVKIDADNLPVARVGDSDRLQVGQPVAAIGNPLGLGISLTGGWISRLNASITFDDGSSLSGLIGTDAAINPGNSGGPIINVDGEVIGITNAKWVETGVEGIGYAISINDAITTINSLITKL